MNRITVTHSQTGQSITVPERFVKTLSRKAKDTLVFDAYNDHPVSAAVVRAMGIEKA